ncbi:putative U3 small nucleolar RNA-associated protein 11, partial [Camellia lanceoleosa]
LFLLCVLAMHTNAHSCIQKVVILFKSHHPSTTSLQTQPIPNSYFIKIQKVHLFTRRREKAAFRNPDEFYFKMIKTKTVDGVHKPESQANKYTQEELMLMKTQDIGYLTAVLQFLDNQPSTRHVFFYAEDREDAKEMQLRTSKVGKVPVFFFEDVPDQIKRKTAASYRELEARKGRVNDLEKLYMDMAMQKELQRTP